MIVCGAVSARHLVLGRYVAPQAKLAVLSVTMITDSRSRSVYRLPCKKNGACSIQVGHMSRCRDV